MLSYLKSIGLQEGETVYVSMAPGYPDTLDGMPLRSIMPRKGNPVTYIEK